MTTPASGARVTAAAEAEEVVSRFGAAWGAHDLAASLALITDDCVFESTAPPDGERHVGRAAIAVAWKPIFDDKDSSARGAVLALRLGRWPRPWHRRLHRQGRPRGREAGLRQGLTGGDA
jgi:hypothetical protein